jgi:acylphosphatase
VELLVEGARDELEAFQVAIPEAGLRRFIRETQSEWSNGTGEFRGFEIAR